MDLQQRAVPEKQKLHYSSPYRTYYVAIIIVVHIFSILVLYFEYFKVYK